MTFSLVVPPKQKYQGVAVCTQSNTPNLGHTVRIG